MNCHDLCKSSCFILYHSIIIQFEEEKGNMTVIKTESSKEKVTKKKDSSFVKTESSMAKQEKKTKSKTKTFEQRLMECTEFKTKFGHCKINTNGKDSNKGLGIWVQEMRRNFKLQMTTGKPRSRISEEHIQQLNNIGFHWGFTPKAGLPQSDEAWNAALEKVTQYHKDFNTFDIEVREEDNKDGGGAQLLYLAEWACDQRDQKKRRDSKMKSNMNKTRVDLLTKIKFNWGGQRKFSTKK